MDASVRFGDNSIIALAGVPGTGKSFVAKHAAQRITNEPLRVMEIQFHPSFSYEEFVEGFRAQVGGGFAAEKGVLLYLNDIAMGDTQNKYVLLIEEFTRANLPSVLGELITYVEYRDSPFYTTYTRRPVKIAPNLMILVTYNPQDRSALELDEAILRRMRVISCPPSEEQLEEMLTRSLGLQGPNPPWIEKLKELFKACRETFEEEFDTLMPFGHGMFAGIKLERPDLHLLWRQRIHPMIRRPLHQPHAFATVIEQHYPWRDPEYAAPAPAVAVQTPGAP